MSDLALGEFLRLENLGLQPSQAPGAVAQERDADVNAFQHRQPEVVKRRVGWVTNMLARLDRAALAFEENAGGLRGFREAKPRLVRISPNSEIPILNRRKR